MALMKMVAARMKIIKEALPRTAIIRRTTCCPVKAATVATATKYRAAAREEREGEIMYITKARQEID